MPSSNSENELRMSTHHYSDPWMVREGNKQRLVQSLRDTHYGPDVPLVHRVIEIYTDKVEVTEYFEPKITLKKISVNLRLEED